MEAVPKVQGEAVLEVMGSGRHVAPPGAIRRKDVP